MHNKHRVIEEHMVVEFAEKNLKQVKNPETTTTSHINNRF